MSNLHPFHLDPGKDWNWLKMYKNTIKFYLLYLNFSTNILYLLKVVILFPIFGMLYTNLLPNVLPLISLHHNKKNIMKNVF